MRNPGLPRDLWAILKGGLWHATARKGLAGIASAGRIEAAVGSRYIGAFSRAVGGISLFDFGKSAVDNWGQFHNWSGWFGHQQQARVAVWIELDRRKIFKRLLDAKQANDSWKTDMARTFIPGVEACHIGPIDADAFKQVLLIDQHDRCLFRSHPYISDRIVNDVDAFERELPPAPPEHLLVAALRSRRLQRPKPDHLD